MPRWEFIVAAAAVVAAFWRQAQRVLGWLKDRLIVTRKCDGTTGTLVLSYMNEHMRRSTGAGSAYLSIKTFVKPLGRVFRVIAQSLHGSSQTFWNGRWPIWFNAESIKSDEQNDSKRGYPMAFSFIRGSLDWEVLLLAAAVWEDDGQNADAPKMTRYCVRYHYGTVFSGFDSDRVQKDNGRAVEGQPAASHWISPHNGVRLLQWSYDDIQSDTVISTIDQLSLRPELTTVVDELGFWHRSKEWYTEHGVPWRRGCVFHGGPGTGKTSLARAVAESLDVPIHVFDLASMSNQDLRSAWRSMINAAPCIALLEDLDAVFEGRKNVSPQTMMGGGLTFDCLLNCIDGIERVDGMLLIVTTNRVETLDDALIKRPGRIDRVVEFKPLDLDGRRKMALRILEDSDVAERLAVEHSTDSAAAFQERCFQVALQRRFSMTNGHSEANGHGVDLAL